MDPYHSWILNNSDKFESEINRKSTATPSAIIETSVHITALEMAAYNVIVHRLCTYLVTKTGFVGFHSELNSSYNSRIRSTVALVTRQLKVPSLSSLSQHIFDILSRGWLDVRAKVGWCENDSTRP